MSAVKIDLHVHPNISKGVSTSEEYISFKDKEIRKVCAKRGVDGVVYTDHIHHPDFWKTQELIPWENDDIVRIPGAEITTSQGKDTLVFGSLDSLKKLDGEFEKRLSKGFFPKLRALYKKAKNLDLKVVSSHHFREVKNLEKEDYNYFDALELDIRSPDKKEKIKEVASEHELPVVAGSDAHIAYGVGIAWTKFNNPEDLNLKGSKVGGKESEKRMRIYRRCREAKKKIVSVKEEATKG